jgi:hypothetical protein
MKRRPPRSNGSVNLSRPIGLDSKTWRSLKPILIAFNHAQSQTGRFRFHPYLQAVYRAYKSSKDCRISKEMARRVSRYFGTTRRKGTNPVRTLIDATFPALDPKAKSQWSRALEFAALAKVSPDDLPGLFKSSAGIAGCARLAAKRKPKKQRYRDDWA